MIENKITNRPTLSKGSKLCVSLTHLSYYIVYREPIVIAGLQFLSGLVGAGCVAV